MYWDDLFFRFSCEYLWIILWWRIWLWINSYIFTILYLSNQTLGRVMTNCRQVNPLKIYLTAEIQLGTEIQPRRRTRMTDIVVQLGCRTFRSRNFFPGKKRWTLLWQNQTKYQPWMTENKSKNFKFHKNLFNKKIICLISSGGGRRNFLWYINLTTYWWLQTILFRYFTIWEANIEEKRKVLLILSRVFNLIPARWRSQPMRKQLRERQPITVRLRSISSRLHLRY